MCIFGVLHGLGKLYHISLAQAVSHLLNKKFVSCVQDLWQYPDRDQWYLAKYAANDQPDWNPARFVRSTQLAPGIK